MCGFTISMKLLYRNDEMLVLAFCNLVGGAFWMLLTKLTIGFPLDWHEVHGEAFIYMAYLIVAATLGTVYLFQKTTVVLGPDRVNAYIYLNPALIAILLYVVDGVLIPKRIIPAILLSAAVTMLLQARAKS